MMHSVGGGPGSRAAGYGLRPGPFLLGAAFIAIGLGLSVLTVRNTPPRQG